MKSKSKQVIELLREMRREGDVEGLLDLSMELITRLHLTQARSGTSTVHTIDTICGNMSILMHTMDGAVDSLEPSIMSHEQHMRFHRVAWEVSASLGELRDFVAWVKQEQGEAEQ